MKRKFLMIIVLAAIVIGGILLAKGNTESTPADDIKQLVNDYSTGKLKDPNASITSRKLVVTKNNGQEVTYDLPADEFFVSIAPFVNQTHPCEIHSLTGCQGELANQEFHLSIKDNDGRVVMDEKVKSMANGFIDLWLPREKTYQITISYNGMTAKSEISTFESDKTCITTMQLMENQS